MQQQQVDAEATFGRPPAACGAPPTEGRDPHLRGVAYRGGSAALPLRGCQKRRLRRQRIHRISPLHGASSFLSNVHVPAGMDPHMQRSTAASSCILSACAL